MKTVLSLISLFLLISSAYSQKATKTVVFSNPLPIPMDMTGTYGDIRMNHYHFGIDLKTDGHEGMPIIAIADGYVSRVRVEPVGYGRSLFISHPNGLTSVYAHLSAFSPAVDKYIREKQYENKSFFVELFPMATLFPVKKGDTIAFSGNAGSSEGAHLHFEIRNSASQNTRNPLIYYSGLCDSQRPIFTKFYLYPLDSGSVNGDRKRVAYGTVIHDTITVLDKKDTIVLNGPIGFGFSAYDMQCSVRSFSGIYSVKLFVDKKLVYYHLQDDLSFMETRYINSAADYEGYLNRKEKIYRMYLQPGNLMKSFYKTLDNRGVVVFNDDKIHKVECEIADVKKNRSRLVFFVTGTTRKLAFEKTTTGQPVYWNRDNVYSDENLKVNIPRYALYENIDFQVQKLPGYASLYAPVYKIHTPDVPIHSSIKISILPTTLPDSLRSKACIVLIGKNGDFGAYNGEWEYNFLTVKTRIFGDYSIAVDTVLPTIRPMNIAEGASMTNQSEINIRIRDDLSGIQDYTALIDGKWVLFEYDPKRNLISHPFDTTYMKFNTKHTLELKVTDNRNNQSTYTTTFYK